MEQPDLLWSFLKQSIPLPKRPKGPGGRPRFDDEKLFKGIMWILRSGARWKDMPKEFGSGKTAHRRHQEWVKKGVYENCYRRLIEYARDRGHISMAEAFIDGSFSPAKKGQLSWAHKTRKRQ